MKIAVTRRFIYLAAIGVLLLGASIFIGSVFTVFIVYNLICAALLLADYFISRQDGEIYIERLGDNRLSIYEREAITIGVYNKGIRRLYIELKDEIPELHFKAEDKIMRGFVEPHGKREFQYFATPTKRGAYVFKNVHVRYEGRLKLCMKMYSLELSREYKVYPNLKNLRKYRLSITNNHRHKLGQRNLKTLGRGTSFESLREYVTGDEYRKINWKATAREGKPIVNQYEPEKNQHVHMLIDTGRPMSYTLRGYRKLDLVVNTAIILSDIVNLNGDQSGLLLFNTDVKTMIMPGKGASHRNKLLDALYHIDHTNLTSNYEEAFYHFKKKERHRSIVFLFTDFETLEEAESMLRVLPVISRNNLLILMLIKNESLEGIGNQEVRNKEDLFNKGVALELINERRRIISLLNRRGIMCTEVEAEKLELSSVNKYIQVKNRNYL